MSFRQTDLLYDNDDYYYWKETVKNVDERGLRPDGLDRKAGNEVLEFINQLGQKYWPAPPNLAAYQKIERMLRYDVPQEMADLKHIEYWLITRWSGV